MNYIKKISGFFCLILYQTLLQAQPPVRIETALERDSILIGDHVDMTLRIAYSPNIAFTFPVVGDTLMPNIEVLRQSKLDTLPKAKKDSFITVERRYTLTSFTAGMIYDLPRFQFVFVRPDGGSDTVASNQLLLKVAYPPMDSTWHPNDIKPPIEYPLTLTEVLPYVGGGLLLAALVALLIYYLYKRQRNQPLFFKPKPKEPAHIVALRNLQKLKEEQLWQQGRTKDFYTRISEIIRIYIEDRFVIPAMEQTSDEILQAFDGSAMCNASDLTALREFFYTADLVKFAKHTPNFDENENSFLQARHFVEQTKRIIEQTSEQL